MDQPYFVEEIGDDGVARITMTRVEVHNAFNDKLIIELTQALKGLESDPRVRVVVLAAEGKSFSAGADLNWMKSMASYSKDENLADAEALGELLRTLNFLSKPTLALVQGAAFGGGVGLIAACDIAIGAEGAIFSLSEVKLGLIPAVISPYVINAMGERAARRYIITGERFDAAEAHRTGLLHEIVPAEMLEHEAEKIVAALLAAGPEAQREAKEGLNAFFEKRPAEWVPDKKDE